VSEPPSAVARKEDPHFEVRRVGRKGEVKNGYFKIDTLRNESETVRARRIRPGVSFVCFDKHVTLITFDPDKNLNILRE